MKTIGIELWAGQARGATPNTATVYGGPRPHVRRSLKDLFRGAYARFADLCREVDEPGLALLAVDEETGAPAGLVRLRARVGRHVAAIVGRHDQCDLFLAHHASLALRHLAVVLDPVASWERGNSRVRYRILDLRTETGFSDEHGKAMRGMRAEGPALMRLANHAVFILPLGDATDWPQSAEDAWSMLPERVYFDEMSCRPEGSVLSMPVASLGSAEARSNANALRRLGDVETQRSFVYRTHGPRETGQGLVMRGDVAGTLEIIGESRYGALQIGDAALRDGVLLGRYARCDGAALLEDPSLSRVHALLIQVDDSLLVVDTASRNGTYLPGQPAARVIPVSSGSEIHLGKHTRIRWRWSC